MDLFLTFCDWAAYSTGLIGAPLGWIEYFYPELADNIEDKIDDSQEYFERLGDEMARHPVFGYIIAGFVLTLFFGIGYYMHSTRFKVDQVHWSLFVIGGLVTFPVLVVTGSYFLSYLVEICNKATGGHALGTIGLSLIIVGLICDSLDKIITPFVPEEKTEVALHAITSFLY